MKQRETVIVILMTRMSHQVINMSNTVCLLHIFLYKVQKTFTQQEKKQEVDFAFKELLYTEKKN
jgi:hypothetical protein